MRRLLARWYPLLLAFLATAVSLAVYSRLPERILALGYPVPMRRILPITAGALFAVMGNVLPRARSNFMYGIRTPWTLSSDRDWARTHRLGGYTMTLAGVT